MKDGTSRPLSAVVYLFGMAGTTVCGTAFVVGGMLAGARGLTAVSLAAIVPLAGLAWAVVLSTIGRGHGRSRRAAGYRVVRDGLADPGENHDRFDRPLRLDDSTDPLVGPGQNHW